MTKLYLAIPCYNEEEVLRDSAQKLSDKFSKMMLEGKITDDSKIVFIDDGSKDKTWSIISELHSKNPVFQGIKLSRNRGHQNALLCGLITLKDKAEAVILLMPICRTTSTPLTKWLKNTKTAVMLCMVCVQREKPTHSLKDLQPRHSIKFLIKWVQKLFLTMPISDL